MSEPLRPEVRVFNAALEMASEAEQAAYVAPACAGDEDLRRKVEALLRAHAGAEEFFRAAEAGMAASGTMRVACAVTEKPGDEIGYYRLQEQIGEGGCGVVYMAEQQEPIRRRVALKVIKLGMDTKQVVARFEAERQALALMDHPNIAKVFDAGATESGRPYFVMELVRGVRINDYCDQNRLSTDQRLKLFVRVCHSIQHAHQKGIIHRDIKPSNILVTINDGVAVPKVIDFGIVKAIGQQLTDKTVYTAFEQFIGTPAYMSPEQATMTSQDIDTRSDIYALGVLLYELLTGHTPFEQKELVAAGLDEMRRIIREKEPARPSTRLSTLAGDEQTTVAKRRQADPPILIHQVRGDLDWIAMKCLEKERTRRYETANGLADDVLHHLQNEPVAARPPSRTYRFQKLVRRNKLVFAAAAAVTAALVIGLGLATWLLFREQAAHRQAVAAQRQAQAQAKKSEQVALFLEDMLRSVGPSVAMGRDTTMLREVLDKTAERVGRDLKDQPEIEAELRSTVARVYYFLGDYTNAEAMHRAALTIQTNLWGNLNTNVASSLSALAFDLSMQGEIEQAEPLFLEALNINTNLLAPGDSRVADSLFCMGFVRSNQGRHAEAERFLRQSIALLRKLSPQNDGQLAKTLGQLSLALNYQGRPAEGESAAREALAIQTRLAQGEPLWDVGYTRVHLGIALVLQHRLDDAEAVLRQAVESYPKVVGAEHWHVVEALLPLSAVLREKGQTDEAERLARQALATSKKVAGHPDQPAHCLLILFSVLGKAGKWAEVESLSRQILEESRQLPPSKSVIFMLAQSADWLRDQGKLSQAELLYREGLSICRNVLTNDFASRQWLAGGLGVLLRSDGRLAEADPVLREGLDLCRTASPADFDRRQWLAAELASTLRSESRLAEADALYREAVTNAVKAWPNAPAKWQWLVNELADVLESQGRAPEVEPLVMELLKPAAQAQVTGICLLRVQARLAGRRGQWKDAANALSKLLALDPSDAYEHLQLAAVLAETGDIERYRAHCGAILKRFAGTDGLDTMAMAAKASLLVPGACPDLETASRMTRRVLAMDTGSSYRSFRPLENGLAEYRHGDYDRAVASMRSVLGQPMPGVSPLTPPERDVAAGAVLAMAHYQLGQGEQARGALTAATNLSQTKLPLLGRGPLDSDWVDWLIAHILLREAKTLVEGEPAASSTEPANPPFEFNRR